MTELGNIPFTTEVALQDDLDSTDAALATHEADTTAVHGITNTADLLDTSTTLDEIAAPAADVSLNSHKITGLAAPSAATDAATKAYADALVSGLNVKLAVRAATTANITLSGEQTIDGIAVVAGDRVLVKNQSTGANNGIYVASAGAWSRSTDADADAEVTSGMFTFVQSGTTQQGTGWVLITANPITVGSTSLSFTQFSGVNSGIPQSIVDAKGDGIFASASDTVARVPAGTDGYVLTAASSETAGVGWREPNPTGVYQLASSVSPGDTQITLDRAPLGIGPGSGWVVIDPWTVECEIRQVTNVVGTVLTLLNCVTLTSSSISFASGPKTITVAAGSASAARKMFWAGGGTKIFVAGSASNNGSFTPTSISADGTVITVSESVVTESAGASVTMRVDVNFSHTTGDRVLVIPDDRVPFSWYGVKSQTGTTDAAGFATDNVKGWNRLVNDSVWQNFSNAILPSDTVYVNDQCYVEDGKHYWGSSQVNSQVKATTSFPAFTNEVAVIHGRDIGQVITFDGAGACRANLHEFKVHGGNNSAGAGSTQDGTPLVPGSNGILMSCQQPVEWDGVRVDNCDGYGVCLTSLQQVDITRLQIIRCRVGVLLRSVSFFFCGMLNIEECTETGFRTQLVSGDTGYNATLIIDHVHTEHHGVVPTVADFDLTRASTVRVLGGHHSASNGSTTYLFVSGKSGALAPVYDIYAEWSGNPAGCTAVNDVIRGQVLNALDALGGNVTATRIMAGTPDPPTAGSPFGYHAINILGSSGSYRRIGVPAGSGTFKPALDVARLPTSSGNRFYAGYNSSGVLCHWFDDTQIGLGTAGVIIKVGSGSPETNITAPVGSLYLRTNGATGTTVYAKVSGSGNTGWIAIG